MTSTSAASSRTNPKKKGKHNIIENSTNPELLKVLLKFRLSEQVEIRRHSELLPKVIISTWRECYNHLDLYEFQQQITGDSLHLFLRKMRRHFTSFCFKGELLEQQLHVLARSGIKEMPGVRDCEITWNATETDSANQKALQALPKLLISVCNLHVHVPVQVGFIEHFSALKNLTLHQVVSREALVAIWKACQCLKRLKILGLCSPSTIGISQCQNLCELTLSMSTFNASSAFEVLQMPRLRLLELLQSDESGETIADCISLVLRQRALDVGSFQLNSCQLQQTNWLTNLELHRCNQMKNLTLINCLFSEQDMLTLGTQLELRKAVFSLCSDLEDIQVCSFYTSCPQLTELHLLDCPRLTSKVLYDLCKWRCGHKVGTPPLQLNLGTAETLKQEFRLHFPLQTTLELLEVPCEEHSQTHHVQFSFLPPVCQQ